MTQPEAAGSHVLHGELVCPTCGNDVLEAVSDGIQTNFLCRCCWHCWHAALGYMEPVPASTCPGCTYGQQCLFHRQGEAHSDPTRAKRSSPR